VREVLAYNITNMIKWLTDKYNLINPLWGLGGITIVVVLAIIKGTIWYDHRNDKTVKTEVRNESWIKMDSVSHRQINTFMEIVLIKLNNQRDSLETVTEGMRKFSKTQHRLQDYMENKVATKDGLLEVQKIFNDEKNFGDEKKNYSQIPYRNQSITSELDSNK
jgi:hypothetical protein